MKLLIALLAIIFTALFFVEDVSEAQVNKLYPSVPLPEGKNCLKTWLGKAEDCGEFWSNYWTPVIYEYEFKFNNKDYKLTSTPHDSKFYKFAGRVIEVKHYSFDEFRPIEYVEKSELPIEDCEKYSTPKLDWNKWEECNQKRLDAYKAEIDFKDEE